MLMTSRNVEEKKFHIKRRSEMGFGGVVNPFSSRPIVRGKPMRVDLGDQQASSLRTTCVSLADVVRRMP